MSSSQSATGTIWALPFAMLGAALGFLLAAEYLPIVPKPVVAPTPQVTLDLHSPSAEPAKRKSEKQPHPAPVAQAKPKPSASNAEDPFECNYALARNGTYADGGVHPELLIDGRTSDYDGSRGFGYTNWRSKTPQAFDIVLAKPVTLNVVRFLLWDKGQRFYRYRLEASEDPIGEDWFMVADRSQESMECRGWQVLPFEPRTIARFRLTGTFNSANSGFHVVEFEAYHVPGGLDYPWIESEF